MDAYILLEKLIQCMLLLGLGFLCGKLGMVDETANRKLSGLLLNVVSPCVILSSYRIEATPALLHNMLLALLAGALSGAALLGGARLFIRRSRPDWRVERMCVAYGNCGFMGLALISQMFGPEGVLYTTMYITVSTLLLWTHGVILMSGAADRQTVMKNLLTPSLISVFLGLAMFIARLRLPALLGDTMEMVGNMNTPMAMLVAGVCIAESDVRAAFSRPRFYYAVFLHNLLIPLVLVLILKALPFMDKEVALVDVILTATPTASASITFALRYRQNHQCAAEIFALSTVASVGSIPLIYLLAEHLL